MKAINWDGNDSHLKVTFYRCREGNYFTSLYKGSCRGHVDPKDCWRVLGPAKFTESGKALKEWAVEIWDKYLPKIDTGVDMDRIKSEGFGPEAHEEDPTANTRMVM